VVYLRRPVRQAAEHSKRPGSRATSGSVTFVQTDAAFWLAAAALVAGVLLFTATVLRTRPATTVGLTRPGRFRRRRPSRGQFRPEGVLATPGPLKRAAIIVNPTKFADAETLELVRDELDLVSSGAGWDPPMWLETTVEDPGTGQARAAAEAGASVVCALGGDGTVRAVAAALAGTDTPMGLLPAGTGNLLARNLDLPVDRLGDALEVALTGQNHRIDVGRINVQPLAPQKPKDHLFLVMAGLGFDAAVMADAPERLKLTVGWLAYTVSGAKNLRGPQFKVRLRVDEGEELTRRVRTVVIGNCGRLQGGLVLMPEAELDDGWLDAVVLAPDGMVGWMAVGLRLASKRRRGHERVEHLRLKAITIAVEEPVEVQIDGDPIGQAVTLTAHVDPAALVVRVG
jgi:diacylglycerol kinase (ATP)